MAAPCPGIVPTVVERYVRSENRDASLKETMRMLVYWMIRVGVRIHSVF